MRKIAILVTFFTFGLIASASTMIIKDTTILKNENLRLEFYFSTSDYGISIFKSPSNFNIRSYEFQTFPGSTNANKTTYTFEPDSNFVGKDTIDFLIERSPVSLDSNSDTLRYIITSKVTDLLVQKDAIRLFPNPSKGQINIYGLSIEEDMIYELFDSSGKLCQVGLFFGDKINTKVKNGIYIFRLSRAKILLFEDKVKIAN